MMKRRVYDGTILADWDISPYAGVCPSDEAERAKWGWKRDAAGRWFRELAPGQRLQDPPKKSVQRPGHSSARGKRKISARQALSH